MLISQLLISIITIRIRINKSAQIFYRYAWSIASIIL